MEKIFATIGIILFSFYIYARNVYTPPPLQEYYNEDAMLGKIQNLANASANIASIPVSQLGEGWATTVQNVPSNRNNWTRSPQATRMNFRFLQPTN